ncbi:type III restriction enzyme, res subunit (macronuclear) [Tetrahymena thermophila SB210]|uniref:Type III restriction enzyme, res subunit n=1 Tax=Tetrahymena thermophila (strain SB210) TaxID=312017 RepID=Q22V99_TETTS|nr:type III restriction enzyme, res subunit [Tetrahymena thermophila SB210]EAR89220.2 type III restriction enzyme, res subunit [Tetrahymena thermophila SB210]|eukprot:XP_001009465.2 type III restriction enzyme, res subunit [Tetrahymena thermophila SB210]
MDFSQFKDESSSESNFEEQDRVESFLKKNETILDYSSIDQIQQSFNSSDLAILQSIHNKIGNQNSLLLKNIEIAQNPEGFNKNLNPGQKDVETKQIQKGEAIEDKQESLVSSQNQNKKVLKNSQNSDLLNDQLEAPSLSNQKNQQDFLQEKSKLTSLNGQNIIQNQQYQNLEQKNQVKDNIEEESLILSQPSNKQPIENNKSFNQQETLNTELQNQQNIISQQQFPITQQNIIQNQQNQNLEQKNQVKSNIEEESLILSQPSNKQSIENNKNFKQQETLNTELQNQQNIISQQQFPITQQNISQKEESLILSQPSNKQPIENNKNFKQLETLNTELQNQQNIISQQQFPITQQNIIQNQQYQNLEQKNQVKDNIEEESLILSQPSNKQSIENQQFPITQQNISQNQLYQNQEQKMIIKDDVASNTQENRMLPQLENQKITKNNQNGIQQPILPLLLSMQSNQQDQQSSFQSQKSTINSSNGLKILQNQQYQNLELKNLDKQDIDQNNEDCSKKFQISNQQHFQNKQNCNLEQILPFPHFLPSQSDQDLESIVIIDQSSKIDSSNGLNILQNQQCQNLEQKNLDKQDIAQNISDSSISSQKDNQKLFQNNQNCIDESSVQSQRNQQTIIENVNQQETKTHYQSNQIKQQNEQMISLNQCLKKQSENKIDYDNKLLNLQENQINYCQKKLITQQLSQQQNNNPIQQSNYQYNNNNNLNGSDQIQLQISQENISQQQSSNDNFTISSTQKQFGQKLLEDQKNIQNISNQIDCLDLDSQNIIQNQEDENRQLQFSSEDEGDNEEKKTSQDQNILKQHQELLGEPISSISNVEIDSNSSFLDEFEFLENKKHSALYQKSKNIKDFCNILKKQKQLKQQYVQIEPRDYQEEIFKNLIQNYGNYIIFLETGTGKTLVSQMIAQYTLSKFKGSKVAFLANQVNLVEQQYNNFLTYQRSIEEYLVKQNLSEEINQNINISFFHGKMNLDFWNRSFWQKNVEQSQIIFFSSQIFLNGLRRGHFQLTQFKLIIFDECHNTSKEHAFSQIMKEFYFQVKKNDIVLKNTPNIIGLSATPITQGNKGNFNVRREMLKLAHNLDCQFINYDLQKVYAQLRNIKQTEKFYEVNMNENDYQYIESNNIKGFDQADKVLYELQEQYPELKELYKQLQALSRLDNLASKAFTQILRKIINLLEEYIIILIYQIGVYVVQFFIFDILQELKGVNITAPKTLCMKQQLEDILQQFYEIFRAKYNNINNDLSNKSQVLLSILSKSEGISLIFCNSKVVVKYVTKFIQSVFQNSNSDQKCCEYIMGQTSQNKKDEEDDNNLKIINSINPYEIQNLKSQSVQQAQNIIQQEKQFSIKFYALKQKYSEQQKIVERFRNKQFKILVSTSVVEEGFDIPSCNIVIAFSKIISQRQYIQMKGRARAENSKFYALVAVYNNNKIKLQNHQIVSDQIKQEYYSLSLLTQKQFSQEKEKHQVNDEDDTSMENYENFIIPETNANVNTFWVKEIVNQFCQSFCYNSQLDNRFPIVFDCLINERGQYLSLIILPFQLQANIFMNLQKLKFKKEDAQRCAFMQAVKSLLKNKYISNELRPRHKSYKNFYFGRGEDDYYVEYSDRYFAIIQKNMQEVFVGYLNGKKRQIVVYKKLYRQIVDEVFVQKEQIQQREFHPFYLYDIQYKGELLQVKLIYDKQCLEGFIHQDIKFIFHNQINLSNEELNEIRKINQQAHLKLLNLDKMNLEPKKIYTSKCLIYKKTQILDYKNTEESVLINENVVFLYIMSDLNQNQIKEIKQINNHIDQIRDFLKLKIISEKISKKLNQEIIDFQNMQIEQLNVFIKPNFKLTGSLSKSNIKQDQKEIYPLQFENLLTLTERDLIQIFQKKQLEKNLVFLGKQYFRFITSINVFNENFKTHYDILISELDMRFNDCFVMSKAVESKFFKYLLIKDYVTLAPCLSIISQKLHTFVADQLTLQEKILIKNHQQNPLNYNMAEIRNKQFTEIIYYIIGITINQNQNIFKNFEKYSSLFQPLLKSFNLIEKYSVLTKFVNIQPEQIQYKPDKQNLLNQFSQNSINYKFNNIGLLQQVFTHSSYKQDMVCSDLNKIFGTLEKSLNDFITEIQKTEKRQSFIQLNDVSNDVLSFLGSIIFSQIVLKRLYTRYSQSNPNELDIFMEIICCEQTKSFLSAKFKLDQYFIYGIQYQQIFQKINHAANFLRQQNIQSFRNIATNYNKDISILSQLFDSLVGAIYIDLQQDFEKTSDFFNQNQHIQLIIKDICQIADQYPKYSLIKVLKQKGYDWEDIQIIKLPHPEQFLPINQNKYNFQIYDIKNEKLLIDKVFECQRIEEAYLAIKEQIINNPINQQSL